MTLFGFEKITSLSQHSQEKTPGPLPVYSRWWVKRVMDKGNGLGKGIGVGEEGAVEFLEFGFDDFRNCRDVKVIVGPLVGDIPGSGEDVTKDFGLETLDVIDVGWLG